jgi:cardiolipin synthase A/B
MSSGSTYNTPAYSLNNKIRLIKGGKEYFKLLCHLIQEAKQSIHIRIYIWDDDATGTAIANELIAAANRNVSVFVVADGYASQCLSNRFVKWLKRHGIHFKYFEPLLKSHHFYFGRRMHEKVVVIDGDKALVGGVNFADRYNDLQDRSAWLDYALLVEGDAAGQLQRHCEASWEGTKKNVKKQASINFDSCSVRISRNDWVNGKHEVWRTYSNWFNSADESITIMCSYFLPGRTLRNRLANAAERGVKVKLILAGPSDVRLAKYAERYLYSLLLKKGIEIYEYQPAVLHAKMMVVDGHWVTIGSYNVNNVSAYASVELNLDIRNKPFALSVGELMDNIIKNDCVKVTEKKLTTNTGFLRRFLQRSAYEVVRAVINLSTFYFKHG